MRYHILNGDVLLNQLQDLAEPKIVMRECLVEGKVSSTDLEDFFNIRAKVFEEYYQITPEGYRSHSVNEIKKIESISANDTIFLWFENDLFCQVNLWFVVYYINELLESPKLCLVSPIKDTWKGFGALDSVELRKSLDQNIELNEEDQLTLCNLWIAYAQSDWDNLRANAAKLRHKIVHIDEVAEAHIERFPPDRGQGRPQKVLLGIINKLKNPSFADIFQEFCRQEGIYGFGDMQVKHLLSELNYS